jgi:hypothetical protein
MCDMRIVSGNAPPMLRIPLAGADRTSLASVRSVPTRYPTQVARKMGPRHPAEDVLGVQRDLGYSVRPLDRPNLDLDVPNNLHVHCSPS